MRRISMCLALLSAVAAGCSMGGKPTVSSGSSKGEPGVNFVVTISSPPLGGYITSDVAGTPAAIHCGASGVKVVNAGLASAYEYTYLSGANACGTDRQTTFPWDAIVTLKAFPNAGMAFYGWAGDCAGTGDCVLTKGADKTIVAIFGPTGGGHGNFLDPALHGAAYFAGTLDCASCHGSELEGQGIAPACASCHDVNHFVGLQPAPEKCAYCHTSTTAAKHAINGKVAVTTVSAPAVSGANVTWTVNVKVDGVNRDGLTATRAYRYAASTTPTANAIADFTRTSITLPNAAATVVGSGGGTGNYVVTFVGGVALMPGNTTLMVRLEASTEAALVRTYATGVSFFNGLARDLVGNQACVNCHGDQVFRERETSGEWHHGVNPYGVQACVVCHTVAGSVSRSAGGDRLTAYVHGVHNSSDMPARSITASLGSPAANYTVLKPAGVYARNDSLLLTGTTASIASPWSVGFPGYMVNCSICHDTTARLNAIMAMPVSTSTCMSCHDTWTGFPPFNPASPLYNAALAATHNFALPAAGTAAANACAACHNGTTAFGTVGDVHDIRVTARNGVVYKGRDLSISEGARVAIQITGVSYTAEATPKLVVTWTATRDGTAVNPCQNNTDNGPVFFGVDTANATTGLAASNMSFLQAFAQGNDWVNAGVGKTPGQPVSSETLTTTNTSCSGNVATSTIATPTTTATRAVIALQGKPQITFISGTFARVIQLRSVSPTYEFAVGTGAASATQRRQIVSTDKCLACHPGSLYQHGGNRVDNNDLCVMCHNPASNEKWYRSSTLGLTAANTYDGKAGETIDMRTMVHAIHSAGETGKALVYYRSNGAYFFGNKAALAANPLWPTTGGISCMNAEGVVATYYRVPGSLATGKVPEVNPDGTCKTGTVDSANGTWLVHNFIEVHYPRALNDCAACHINGSEQGFGDQSQRMAVTVDPGAVAASSVAINGNQLDDVLRGAGAQSCFTCHQSGDAATQAALQAHGTSHGFAPAAFTNGRADLVACALGTGPCP